MTPERIAELRALAEKANLDSLQPNLGEMPTGAIVAGLSAGDDDLEHMESVLAFIAAARTALPEALDAIERVRALCNDPFMVFAGDDGIGNASKTRRAVGTMPMLTIQDVLAALDGIAGEGGAP